MGVRRLLQILLLSAISAATGGAHASETAGAFAIRGGSARGAVLGEAYGAVGGDADVMLWSPAALIRVTEPHLQATYQDIYGLGLARYSSVAVAWRAGREEVGVSGDSIRVTLRQACGAAYGLSLSALAVDLDGETYYEFSPSIGIAQPLSRRSTIGVTARYLRASSTLADLSAMGYALDLGAHTQLHDRLDVALAMRNLLGRLSWDGREESMPRELSLAAAAPVNPSLRLLAGAATDLAEEPADRFNLAAEAVLWPEHWHVLAGWEGRRSGDEIKTRYAVGMRLAAARLAVDYAFLPAAYTPGDTHRVTLGIIF